MQEYHLYICLRCGNVTPVQECRDDPECSFCHFTMMHLRDTIPLPESLLQGTYWSTIRRVIKKNINRNAKVFDPELFDKREQNDRILEQKTTTWVQAVQAQMQAQMPEPVQYIPRCPTCGSPNIYNRGPVRYQAALFPEQRIGLKQFVCGNCGYEW